MDPLALTSFPEPGTPNPRDFKWKCPMRKASGKLEAKVKIIDAPRVVKRTRNVKNCSFPLDPIFTFTSTHSDQTNFSILRAHS